VASFKTTGTTDSSNCLLTKQALKKQQPLQSYLEEFQQSQDRLLLAQELIKPVQIQQ